MSLTIHVNGSANSLVHKGSNGIANSTVPDVCKTPSPAGPVPIPYPVIVSMSSDLESGSTTVTADGGNMIAIKDCDFSKCTGDEAGTAGGVVSSTNMKEAKFILYSFDVKIDGGNACRLSDKMTMNHANTVCLAGILQKPVTLLEKDLVRIAKKCQKQVEQANKNKRPRESCTVKGTRKHKCCEDAINDMKAKGKHPNVKPEYVHKDCRLDVAVLSGGSVSKIYDFKFNCKSKPKMSKTQERKYKKRFGRGIVIKLIGGR